MRRRGKSQSCAGYTVTRLMEPTAFSRLEGGGWIVLKSVLNWISRTEGGMTADNDVVRS